MIKGTLFNFLFLIFLTILFTEFFLLFPFLENYFTNIYIDISVIENQGSFGFGIIRFTFLEVFLNLIISIITNLILFRIKFNRIEIFLPISILLNLNLFLWLNSTIAEFIMYPFNQFSIIHFLLMIFFFIIYWISVSKLYVRNNH